MFIFTEREADWTPIKPFASRNVPGSAASERNAHCAPFIPGQRGVKDVLIA